MAAYIDDFLTLQQSLPEITKCILSTIKKCDNAYYKNADKLEKIAAKYANNTVVDNKDVKDIAAIRKHMETLCDAKISLSTKLYDLVDEHLKTGSKKLKQLENVLKSKQISISIDDNDFHVDNKNKRKNNNKDSSRNTRLKPDHSEPVYCICQQVNHFIPLYCIYYLYYYGRLHLEKWLLVTMTIVLWNGTIINVWA